MNVRFSVTEVQELFTTFDYKQLIKAVEAHFNESAKFQGVHVSGVIAFYNPERNEGIIHFDNTYDYIYLDKLQHAYGNDFVTIKFNN